MTTRTPLPFDLVDVFAARPLKGNLLAVVHDADGVADATMRRLATRFRLVAPRRRSGPTPPESVRAFDPRPVRRVGTPDLLGRRSEWLFPIWIGAGPEKEDGTSPEALVSGRSTPRPPEGH